MQKNILFRGCTRPAMFMGVPYLPFFAGVGGCLLLALYISLFFLLLIPLVIFVLRMIAKQDEMIFRLWGLRMKFRFKVRNQDLHDNMWVFSPNQYREKPAQHHPRT